MNHQDPVLRKNGMTSDATNAYENYIAGRKHNERLMKLLFVNPDSVRGVVSDVWLNYYLIKMRRRPVVRAAPKHLLFN